MISDITLRTTVLFRISVVLAIVVLAATVIHQSRTSVYDAETTHGGSGGPVLDIHGAVVAVNAAIIPEFGGSNLGVPVEHARQLLADAEVQLVKKGDALIFLEEGK